VTVGLAAIVFAGTSILLLIGDRGRSRDPKLARRLVSVALAAAAGVLVGLVGRLATALSDGANIGGVAAILLGLPSALALLMGALLIGRAGGEGAENAPAG
jgi:hypothetical protein